MTDNNIAVALLAALFTLFLTVKLGLDLYA
uniref:Photosystem I reaction center subunit M n=2 Tax=Heterosigma akashiwo TaxID=2829 RepID=B2XT22_HETAK|nr:photosystem I subunit XII [Heterosigma akashiwo]YP_001936356.1 photosystem I subunit XII [Heterosigma akashiwo]ABV65920.1 photosystem I reaction center subunit M [Heterosigma akashiwo]ABV65962.1 photosystem I reaction center subunit M [Heterosigma akashiwo]ABV70061.1 photosystem I reaction center subunit M [Heterosigma akashiwo]ABV70103.1 photosystem I reaction center subunit M [Heterosigma akashiwo]